jgi:murein DD-endopeptidase MepM/ murein hydrolase activator NlpD
MAGEFYTLIIVPHAKARFRKFQVSLRLARWAGWAGTLGGLALLTVVLHYASVAWEVRDARRLRAENALLSAKNKDYEANASRMEAKVAQLQGVVTKLGVMAGLEHSLPDPSLGGVGGVPSFETTAPSRAINFQSMDRSLSSLTDKSEQLEKFFQGQQVLLSSTPSIWPVRGYLSTTFGNRIDPFTSQIDFHSGIDISTPIGTPVQAPSDGVVVSCENKGGYGNSMILDHGHGVVTRYAHLERYKARPGQRVQRGDVIAFVGNTGKSTGPHLHYEVWVHDQAQNPIHYILDEYRSFR